jgi:hypothetical protein
MSLVQEKRLKRKLVRLRRGDEPVVFLPIEYINKKINKPPEKPTNRLI